MPDMVVVYIIICYPKMVVVGVRFPHRNQNSKSKTTGKRQQKRVQNLKQKIRNLKEILQGNCAFFGRILKGIFDIFTREFGPSY